MNDQQRITASHNDRFVDEVIVADVSIHLERMADGHVWIGVYRKGVESDLHIDLFANRKDDLIVSAWWDGDPWPGNGVVPPQAAAAYSYGRRRRATTTCLMEGAFR